MDTNKQFNFNGKDKFIIQMLTFQIIFCAFVYFGNDISFFSRSGIILTLLQIYFGYVQYKIIKKYIGE